MAEQSEKPRRRRDQTMIRLLPRVKRAAQEAAEAEGRSLSGWIEAALIERLKEKGYFK
jgi:predicted HicB family RNase H-like nuclease